MKNLKPLFTILLCAVFGLTLTMLYTGCVSSAESEDIISYDYDYDFTYEDEVFVLDEGIPGKILEIPLDEFTLQGGDVAGSQDPSDPKYGSSYNPETHVLVSNGGAGFGRWWPHIDASEYNSLKIQYKVKDGCTFGSVFCISYVKDATHNYDVFYYIPSYLTEYEIPLLDDKKGEIAGFATHTWGRPCMNTEIEFKSITLQTKKITGPTNPNYTTQAPLIDTGTQVAFDDQISSIDLVNNLGAGINMANYLNVDKEYDWGMDYVSSTKHPGKVTRANIQKIKDAGFKTIRLAVNFGEHIMGSKNTVDPRFMAEVKEVVDMCIDEGLYVVLCDMYSSVYVVDYWQYNHYLKGFSLQPELEEESTAFVICLWKQIALAFNNSYDEHLLFEFINEPNAGLDGTNEWSTAGDEQFRLVKKYNQLILNTVRASGGNNSKRFCVVESICGSPQYLCDKRFRLPADSADDKLIACFHMYPMGNNAGASAFKRCGDVCLAVEKQKIADVYKKYVKKQGIGTLISEYGTNMEAPLSERLRCIEGTIPDCYEKGISAFLFDLSPLYFDFVSNTWPEQNNEVVKLFTSIANNTARPASPTAAINKYSGTPTMLGKELLTEPLEIYSDGKCFFYGSGASLGYLPDTVKVQIKAEPVGTGEHYVKVHTGYFVGANNWNDLFTLTDDKITGGTAYTGKPHQREITGATTITYQLDAAHVDNITSFGLHLEGMNVKVTSIKLIE